jgi:hypothetical protein
MQLVARLALASSIGLVCALAGREAAAEARYVELPEAVRDADTIAIVHTYIVEPAEIQGEFWTYRQRVRVGVIATLKGESHRPLEIAANKEFICAPVPFAAGVDYLVFLADDGDHKATVNNEMGRLAITNGFVEWPYGGGPRVRALPDAMLEIQRLVGDPAPMAEVQASPPSTNDAPAEAPRVVEAEPDEPATSLAPVWIGTGAFAVVLGMVVARRRRLGANR